MSLDELASWDAVETAERLARRDVTPREVLEAAIARAERARHLGAIVTDGFERALAAEPAGGGAPLAGVPTFIKDLYHLSGVPTHWGSRGAGAHVPTKSTPFVARLEQLGLVPLGKSATPEFGLTATTEPLGWDPCRNPHDPTRSSGGSSGGAASLVAAGVVPIAHASDGGGSIRIPAACCGLVGLKSSRYRMDMEGSNLLPINVAVDGVVTRTVRDTVALHEAMDARWPSRKAPAVQAVAPEPPRKLRIGAFVDSPLGRTVDPEIREATTAAARLCEELGHHVEAIDCPFSEQVVEDFLWYWSLLAWLQVRTARVMLHGGFDASKVEPFTDGLVRRFRGNVRAAWAAGRRLRRFGAEYARVLGGYDVLVSPTTGQPAPPLGHLSNEAPFETALDRLRDFVPFTPIQNTAGAPGISLPLGRTAAGLPIGVHFAAAHGGDRLLLELARSIETARPWETRPTARP